MGDTIPPKNTTKKEPEPEIGLPPTKVDVLNPSKDAQASIELSKDAWEVFNIDNLPTISDEQMERYVKHTNDRRTVWIKSNISKTSFPIRCRIMLAGSKEDDPEFENDEDGNPKLIIKNFRYNPISLFEREKIVTLSSEIADLQRVAQGLMIVRSIDKGEGLTDIKIDFKSLPETLQHEDFAIIQSKLMKKQLELNRYRFKAYFNMSKTDMIVAYWGDVRDWLDVCIEKEQHVLDPMIGVM